MVNILQNRFLSLFNQVCIERRKAVLNLCEENPAAKLLDCGCGDGEFTLEVARGIGTNQVFGIDVVEGNINKAREKGVTAFKADLNCLLPFESETFDVIHASNIIEHLSETDMFLKEIYRCLSKGGSFVGETANLAGLHNIFFLLLGKLPPAADVSDEFHLGGWHSKAQERDSPGPGHRRIFTPGALEELFQCHGLSIEKSIGVGYYPLPITLARAMCRIDKRHSAHMAFRARKIRQ